MTTTGRTEEQGSIDQHNPFAPPVDVSAFEELTSNYNRPY